MSDGYRNYGPGVSQNPQSSASGGSFSGDDRAYESVVIQAEAPVIDWEMNLRGQVEGDYGLRRGAQRLRTSCFLGGDFLETSDPSGSFDFPAATVGNENVVSMFSDDALINGWHVRVDFSGTTTEGLNVITLPVPPVSGTRTDLVVLEVWRALVVAAPSTDNKSPGALIFRLGNVKCPDGTPNLTDDLVDPNYGQESNARVQIQYRLRVVPGVDLDAFPDGIDDPTVVANTVSDWASDPVTGGDGTATAYTYSLAEGDKGLWIAGEGNPTGAAALGTVDGLMYAVPVCAVRRRNSSAFDRATNMNGAATVSAGTSDRPDGLFSDIVVPSDLVDLRRCCGSQFEEVMEKAFQQVLDNSMCTRSVVSDLGTVGTSFLYRDNVGDAASAPSGVGEGPGNPDSVRRYFGDRPVAETIVFVTNPLADAFAVDISDIPLSNPAGAATLPWNASAPYSILSNAPEGTCITEVLRVRMNNGTVDVDLFDPDNPTGIYVLTVTYGDGIDGTDTKVSFTLSLAATGPVYIEVALGYPSGAGLSRNVVESFQLWARPSSMPAWTDTTGWTASPDATRYVVPPDPVTAYDGSQWWVDAAHRELAMRQRTTSQSYLTYAEPVSGGASLTGSNEDPAVDTSSDNVLLIRTDPFSGFTSVPVTSGVATDKTTIRDDINAAAIGVTASVVGTNQIKIESVTGYIEIDSVSNGSTLNTPLGLSSAGDVVGPSYVMIPERLTGDPVTVNDGVGSYATTDYTVNTAYTRLHLQRPIPTFSSITVSYTAYRPALPLSSSSDAYNVFYQSRAMQTVPVPAGTQTLRLVPRAVGRTMSVIVTGPGSPDDSFPFTAPGDQVPIGLLPAPDYPESQLDGPADVYLANFNINSGFMQLTPFIPYAPNPGQVTLFSNGGDTTLDAEGRSFWPKSFDVSGPPVYSPAIYAQELFFGRRHKVAVPVLMELKDDFDGLGQQGMSVLVVFAAWLEYDPDCRVVLLPTLGDSCAGVYRVRGNLMNPRRPRY